MARRSVFLRAMAQAQRAVERGQAIELREMDTAQTQIAKSVDSCKDKLNSRARACSIEEETVLHKHLTKHFKYLIPGNHQRRWIPFWLMKDTNTTLMKECNALFECRMTLFNEPCYSCTWSSEIAEPDRSDVSILVCKMAQGRNVCKYDSAHSYNFKEGS